MDEPESAGDGFFFSGGKYSDGPSRSDEWFAQGKMVKAYPVYGGKGKAKDPVFGLTLGAGSQSEADLFRWFCVEAGSSLNPKVILVHGFPSQVLGFLISLSLDMDSTILWMNMFRLWDRLSMSLFRINFP